MFTIEIDMSEVQKLADDLKKAPQNSFKRIHASMKNFGVVGTRVMKRVLRPNRYTGQLEQSVGYDYSQGAFELVIGPNAKRRNADAGAIMQHGTGAIPNVPWRPIVAWAIHRGFDKPFALYRKIQSQGVNAHPFITETAQDGEFRRGLDALSKNLGDDVVASITVRV